MTDNSTSSVSARDRGLAGRPRRGSTQPPLPPAAERARSRFGRRGAARSRRLAGPVPTARRADRPAVVDDERAGRVDAFFVSFVEEVAAEPRRGADALVEDLVDDAREDDDDRVDDAREDDDDREDDAREDDDDREDDALVDDDDREDDVRAERVVDRAGERRDPLGRAPPPPIGVRPEPLREVIGAPFGMRR